MRNPGKKGWLEAEVSLSASDVGMRMDVGADGSEEPRLQAVGRVPTVAAMGSRAPKGAATRHTEQSTHQVAIWAALGYASTYSELCQGAAG